MDTKLITPYQSLDAQKFSVRACQPKKTFSRIFKITRTTFISSAKKLFYVHFSLYKYPLPKSHICDCAFYAEMIYLLPRLNIEKFACEHSCAKMLCIFKLSISFFSTLLFRLSTYLYL